MSFVLSKVFWMLARPGNLLTLLLLGGIGFGAVGRRRAARVLIAASAAGFTAVAVLPLGPWLAAPLENRFPAPDPAPARVDGIIVLGGAVRPDLTADRRQPALNEAAERMTALAGLARRYPYARLVFTGGSGALFPGRLREADVARALFDELGLDARRIVYEAASRNTFENAAFARPLAAPQPGEVWLLVTSAMHMPRSVGVFRHAGWPVLPWPVDYRTGGGDAAGVEFDLGRNLICLDDALKEWIGLLAYRLLDRTDVLFPGPADLGAAPPTAEPSGRVEE